MRVGRIITAVSIVLLAGLMLFGCGGEDKKSAETSKQETGPIRSVDLSIFPVPHHPWAYRIHRDSWTA